MSRKRISELSCEEFCDLLLKRGVTEDDVKNFKDNQISGVEVSELDDTALKELFPLLGHRLKIKAIIQEVQSSAVGAENSGPLLCEKPNFPLNDDAVAGGSSNCTLTPQVSMIHPLQEHNVRPYPTIRNICLPSFSEPVRLALQAEKPTPVWRKIVEELAEFVIQQYKIHTKEHYKLFGQAMYQKYPCIESLGTENPWSFLTKSLSQKIRNMKWNEKRKSTGNSPGASTVTRQNLLASAIVNSNASSLGPHRNTLSDEDSAKHLEEMNKELQKEKKNMRHLRQLMVSSFHYRQQFIKTESGGSLKKVLAKFPALQLGEFVFLELTMLVSNCEGEDLDARVLSTFEKLRKMANVKSDLTDDEGNIEAFQYMEKATGMKSRKGSWCSVLTVKEADEVLAPSEVLQVPEMDAPRLVIFMNEGQVTSGFVTADACHISCNSKDFIGCLLILLGSYYLLDLEYPKRYLHALGFLQESILKHLFKTKCSKFLKFRKEFSYL